MLPIKCLLSNLRITLFWQRHLHFRICLWNGVWRPRITDASCWASPLSDFGHLDFCSSQLPLYEWSIHPGSKPSKPTTTDTTHVITETGNGVNITQSGLYLVCLYSCVFPQSFLRCLMSHRNMSPPSTTLNAPLRVYTRTSPFSVRRRTSHSSPTSPQRSASSQHLIKLQGTFWMLDTLMSVM